MIEIGGNLLAAVIAVTVGAAVVGVKWVENRPDTFVNEPEEKDEPKTED